MNDKALNIKGDAGVEEHATFRLQQINELIQAALTPNALGDDHALKDQLTALQALIKTEILNAIKPGATVSKSIFEDAADSVQTAVQTATKTAEDSAKAAVKTAEDAATVAAASLTAAKNDAAAAASTATTTIADLRKQIANSGGHAAALLDATTAKTLAEDALAGLKTILGVGAGDGDAQAMAQALKTKAKEAQKKLTAAETQLAAAKAEIAALKAPNNTLPPPPPPPVGTPLPTAAVFSTEVIRAVALNENNDDILREATDQNIYTGSDVQGAKDAVREHMFELDLGSAEVTVHGDEDRKLCNAFQKWDSDSAELMKLSSLKDTDYRVTVMTLNAFKNADVVGIVANQRYEQIQLKHSEEIAKEQSNIFMNIGTNVPKGKEIENVFPGDAFSITSTNENIDVENRSISLLAAINLLPADELTSQGMEESWAPDSETRAGAFVVHHKDADWKTMPLGYAVLVVKQEKPNPPILMIEFISTTDYAPKEAKSLLMTSITCASECGTWAPYDDTLYRYADWKLDVASSRYGGENAKLIEVWKNAFTKDDAELPLTPNITLTDEQFTELDKKAKAVKKKIKEGVADGYVEYCASNAIKVTYNYDYNNLSKKELNDLFPNEHKLTGTQLKKIKIGPLRTLVERHVPLIVFQNKITELRDATEEPPFNDTGFTYALNGETYFNTVPPAGAGGVDANALSLASLASRVLSV
jgi:hypothetical protein